MSWRASRRLASEASRSFLLKPFNGFSIFIRQSNLHGLTQSWDSAKSRNFSDIAKGHTKGSRGDFSPKSKENDINWEEVKTKLDNLLSSHKVVLFMKGTPDQPECGFSAKVVSILKTAGAENDYTFVNVLTHPTIRDGIKKYSDWPTIPQLYVDGNFVGGCDIIVDLYDKGELHNLLDRALKHTKT
eukprot:GHVQ01023770.1.p1 GENE.GHVQ01023770.1~~GHVQ01023770.1.p1  ORF type:complete len:186 (+),score=13.08 GHVQ01023770.1:180-737(+)